MGQLAHGCVGGQIDEWVGGLIGGWMGGWIIGR